MGQDIPDISQVIRFGAPETPEALKQYFGRAGRDLSVLADGHLLLERSCFQTQKKNVRKKQKTTAAAAVDAAQALSTSVPVSTLSDNLPFPLLLADDQLPDHLEWRKKLEPDLRLYAAAQSPCLGFLNTSPTTLTYLHPVGRIAGLLTPSVCRSQPRISTNHLHSWVIYLSHRVYSSPLYGI
ncbi:hypothetical protein R3P38DRAFT_3209790 [Favolaschia claudopus]|uniref:Uncharacterized protein n=1 Tax=Favolaschia claudopus TaxID=2862362 RepID=A0AAW0AIY5_9AGAR